MLDLTPIKEHLSKVTRRPWAAVKHDITLPEIFTIWQQDTIKAVFMQGDNERTLVGLKDNCEFVAQAPEYVDALIAEVERLQGELEKIAMFNERAKFVNDKAVVIPTWRLLEAIDDMRKIAWAAIGSKK